MSIRAWIHAQLGSSPDCHEASGIVARWKTARMATINLTRAILLYNALMKGDTTLLSEYFPGFAAALGRPQPARRAPAPAPTITYVAKSEQEDLADAIGSIGFDGLEF